MNGSEQPPEQESQPSGRGGDRRRKDRRRQDRRTPLPLWRQPWAFVVYGVVGAFLVVLLLTRGDDPRREATPAAVGTQAALPEIDTSAAGAAAPVADAYGSGGHASLLAEGSAAAGRRVRAELFCEEMRQVALRTGSNITVSASVAENADAEGRVAATECRWGSEVSAPTVLLVVPAALAAQFASTPEVEQSFVRRRRVAGEVEWIGRSEALALRTAAVLRSLSP